MGRVKHLPFFRPPCRSQADPADDDDDDDLDRAGAGWRPSTKTGLPPGTAIPGGNVDAVAALAEVGWMTKRTRAMPPSN